MYFLWTMSTFKIYVFCIQYVVYLDGVSLLILLLIDRKNKLTNIWITQKCCLLLVAYFLRLLCISFVMGNFFSKISMPTNINRRMVRRNFFLHVDSHFHDMKKILNPNLNLIFLLLNLTKVQHPKDIYYTYTFVSLSQIFDESRNFLFAIYI